MTPLFLMTAFTLSRIEPIRFYTVDKELISMIFEDDIRVPSVFAALG